MAYSTGTASTDTALVDAIKNFATSNGFTHVQSYTDSNGDYIVVLSRNSLYYYMRTDADGDHIMGSICTNYTASRDWDAVDWNGHSENKCAKCYPINFPIIGYHLFSPAAGVIHCVIESIAGAYRHYSFGELVKAGSWSGGQYFVATDYNNGSAYVGSYGDTRHVIMWDGDTNNNAGDPRGIMYTPFQTPTTSNVMSNFGSVNTGMDLVKGPMRDNWQDKIRVANPSNLRAYAAAVEIFAEVPTSNNWYLLGYVDGVRYLNMEYLEPEDVVDTDWVVFPLGTKGFSGVVDAPESQYDAVMYKK